MWQVSDRSGTRQEFRGAYVNRNESLHDFRYTELAQILQGKCFTALRSTVRPKLLFERDLDLVKHRLRFVRSRVSQFHLELESKAGGQIG